MSKHFTMYITINNFIDEKIINLAYPIQGKEVAVVSMFSDNIGDEFTEPWTIELESRNKRVMAGTTDTRRELTDLVGGRIKLTESDKHPRINRTNKLAGIAEMVLSLDELDNTDKLEDGNSATHYLLIT